RTRRELRIREGRMADQLAHTGRAADPADRAPFLIVFDASFTCDLEPDCPPYLRGFRGVEEGLPKLLALLSELGIRGTFFTTGEVATKYPEAARAVLAGGHELACHGMTHTAFTK